MSSNNESDISSDVYKHLIRIQEDSAVYRAVLVLSFSTSGSRNVSHLPSEIILYSCCDYLRCLDMHHCNISIITTEIYITSLVTHRYTARGDTGQYNQNVQDQTMETRESRSTCCSAINFYNSTVCTTIYISS